MSNTVEFPHKETIFLTLDCRCKNGHEWKTVIARYWFLPECKICNGQVDAVRMGPYQVIGDTRQGQPGKRFIDPLLIK